MNTFFKILFGIIIILSVVTLILIIIQWINTGFNIEGFVTAFVIVTMINLISQIE